MKVKNFATALGDILVDQQIPGHNQLLQVMVMAMVMVEIMLVAVLCC